MSEFTVRGSFQTPNGTSEFTKTVEAPNEEVARDRIYSELGSEHGLKRTQVDLTEVSEVSVA